MFCKKSPHIMPIVKYFFIKLVCFYEAFLYIIKFVNYWGAYWSFGNREKTMLLAVKKLKFAKFWV